MFITRPHLRRANETGLSRSRPIEFELDIIGIPAIGGDPEKTWGQTVETQWLGPRLNADFPNARILLWDHLNLAERDAVAKVSEESHEADAYHEASRSVSRLRMQDWADRLLEGLDDERAHVVVNRPIVFISHSTGGIVLKEALCRTRGSALVKSCLGITFFAAPHHGSNILSLAACADTVKDRLGLKWPLGTALREQLGPQSPYLESLNQAFSLLSLGIEIWSYAEEQVLSLQVNTELLPQRFRGKKQLQLADPIVDKRSAYMTTSDHSVTIEEEVMLHVNANHVTLPRLDGDEDLQREYLEELFKLTNEKAAQDRNVHQRIIGFIQDRAKVSIIEFYNDAGRKLNPVNTLPPRYVALRDFVNADFDFGMIPETPGLGSLPTIITDFAPSNSDHPSAIHVASSAPPIVLGDRDASPGRGRPSRLHIADDLSAARRLSQSRGASRTRSRHRSMQIEAQVALSHQAISGQRIDSILLSGSSGAPRKESPFIWAHMPFCVSSWVPQILSAVSRKRKIPNLHWRLIAREHWLTHHNRARHSASHAQYVKAHFQSVWPEQAAMSVIPGLPPPPSGTQIPDGIQFALFLPFLHWDTFAMQQKRAHLIKLRNKYDDPRYVDSELLSTNNLEHLILWQYLLSEAPVHARRSLDQYGYPALRNTEVRDADQVLYKKTRSHNQEQSSSNIPQRKRLARRLHFAKSSRHKSEHVHKQSERPPTVISIDSLWMWVLRHDTVVTFASKRQRGNEDPKMAKQADLVDSIHHAARQDKLKDSYDLAALIVNKCVTVLLEETEDSHLQIFHVFEEYLSDLTENYTHSFKLFRNLQRLETVAGLTGDDGSDLDPTDTYASRQDLFHLFELRDITDELSTIRKLFTEQQKQVLSMRDEFQKYLEPLEKGIRALQLLRETLDALEAYIDTVDTMLKSSDAMQKSYEKLLDMKTAKANVDEAHAARKQTEVSTQQSKTITVFTLVTIVFSPLSFMASVFGMNVSDWSGVPTNPPLDLVLKFLGLISLAVIVAALLVAFNHFTRRFFAWIWEWIAWLFVGGLNLLGLGWVVEASSDALSRMLDRLPRNPFGGSSTPTTLSRTSTMQSTKSLTQTVGTRAGSTMTMTMQSPSRWARKRLHRGDTMMTSETVEDLDFARKQSLDAKNSIELEDHIGPVPEKRRMPTWGTRARRVSTLFTSVRYDQAANRVTTEEPPPV